mmetsp:Transcript_29691/g.58278  ORF Transcript_29691/g.58278 Transcript_29691/m.58278 type:complete len:95 (-) Transcript_29691:134-418(-)
MERDACLVTLREEGRSDPQRNPKRLAREERDGGEETAPFNIKKENKKWILYKKSFREALNTLEKFLVHMERIERTKSAGSRIHWADRETERQVA